jgi:uncharacterized protein HemX
MSEPRNSYRSPRFLRCMSTRKKGSNSSNRAAVRSTRRSGNHGSGQVVALLLHVLALGFGLAQLWSRFDKKGGRRPKCMAFA